MATITNKFPTSLSDFGAPPIEFEAVTPHASTNFAQVCRAIYVGVGGTVVAVALNDTAYTFAGVPSGAYLLGCFKRVNAIGTTATTMIAVV